MRNVVPICLALAAAAPATAQSTFHGNVARTGVYEGSGPAKAPATKWAFKTGGPIVGSPVVAAGVVYVASLDTYLYAIERDTGKEKWRFKSRMPIASTPAIGDELLYFVSSTGALAAIEIATGQPKWVFAAEYEKKFEAKNLHGYPPAAQSIPDAWDVFISSPAIANGKVYFGSGDGNVYAVDAKTGLLQWKFPTKDVVHASPAVAGGTVYVGSWDSALYALDAETGQLRWTFEAGQDPAIHNQVGFQSSPAVVDGTVYVGTSDTARVMALDAKTGRLKFNFSAKAYVFSSAAIAGKLVYVGNHAGRLFAIDAKTGELAWEFKTDAAKRDPFKVVADDGSLNQQAFAPLFNDFQDMYLDFSRYASVGAIMSSPVVDSGVLFVGSMDGNLYALE
jgi:outer membrane protein assembly factor BamB